MHSSACSQLAYCFVISICILCAIGQDTSSTVSTTVSSTVSSTISTSATSSTTPTPTPFADGMTTETPITNVVIPPLIVLEPDYNLAFRQHESIQLPCLATGDPEPTYRWTMNDKEFNPSGNMGRIAIQPGSGTLIFADPLDRDEAVYQCLATNQAGTALTIKTNLRVAYLDPFPVVGIKYMYPQLGSSLTLKCTRPRSYPQPNMFWAVVAADSRFYPIYLTDRITMDPEGNLQLANVISADYQSGNKYACVAENQAMRSMQQGEYVVITPTGQSALYYPPSIKWVAPTQQVALLHQQWRVKCIFAGNPTPRVDWNRLNAPLPARAHKESFGMELVIDDIQFEDAGNYECNGLNEQTMVPIRRSVQLTIQASPYWLEQPQSVNAEEGNTVVFYCRADGLPSPTNTWFINGNPISSQANNPRMIVEKHKITFFNVTKKDAQVIQCNATNKYGYIYTNAYMNIQIVKPIILDPPVMDMKAAEAQTINLTCNVLGIPQPLVVWLKGSEQLTGGHFTVMPEGHLQITEVSLVDAGTYTCNATNKWGTTAATGSLIVRRRTKIQMAPQDVMVYENSEAKFTCTATTDPEEVVNLHIDWLKDGQLLDYAVVQRVFKNDLDNSLTISGTIPLDTGAYTCMASDGLDSDSADAQLLVQGKPDAPLNVLVRCSTEMLASLSAEVNWTPGRENYAPILNFVIQFNTTFSPDTWIDIADNISQNERSRVVNLTPWANYTFRVLARNKVGLSPPSVPSQQVCTTQPARPWKNPDNVIGEGDLPDNLVIFWTPMPKLEWNDPSFYYSISYIRADQPNQPVISIQIFEPLQWHYVAPEKFSTPYIPFNISVSAANSQGSAIVPSTWLLGRSGEDTPLVAPNDVHLLNDTAGSTTATLVWSHIDDSPDSIRGFFRGYRIQYGRTTTWPNGVIEEDYILQAPAMYPRPRVTRLLQFNARRKRRSLPAKGEPVQYTITHLPPNSEVMVQVRVLSKYYAGPPSNQLTFLTQEGVPGPPATFDILSRAATYLDVYWNPPFESNGVLTGYTVSYQAITGLNLGGLQYANEITNATLTSSRITGLKPNTSYRVYIAASTGAGLGDTNFLDSRTLTADRPNPPVIGILGWNDTSIEVTWEPSRIGNPGSVFYTQYRARSWYQWTNTADEYLKNTAQLIALSPGTTYQIRVVAKNGDGNEAPSEWQEVTTTGIAPGRYAVGVSGWFYGIFVALIIIGVFLVLFIIFKSRADAWWEEKEGKIQEEMRNIQAEEAAAQFGFMVPQDPEASLMVNEEDLAAMPPNGGYYATPGMVDEYGQPVGYVMPEDDAGPLPEKTALYGSQEKLQPQRGSREQLSNQQPVGIHGSREQLGQQGGYGSRDNLRYAPGNGGPAVSKTDTFI